MGVGTDKPDQQTLLALFNQSLRGLVAQKFVF